MTQDAASKHIRTNIPKACHLWNDEALTRDALAKSLVPVKEYADELHLIRSLMRCTVCGHLYFHEFYEEIDKHEGTDVQYMSWIPVDDEESGEMAELQCPQIDVFARRWAE